MENTTPIISSLNVPSLLPLDAKAFSLSEATLKDLGTNNNLAYTYHDSLQVTCQLEKSVWEWRQVEEVEDTPGLLDEDFTYPNGIVVNDVDYSLKTYNFFLPKSLKNLLEEVQETKVDKVAGKSLVDNDEIAKLENLDNTKDIDKPLSEDAIEALALKLAHGGYIGTAEDLRVMIISAVTGVTGTSLVPSSPAFAGSGIASGVALQAGTYTNLGGVIVNANSIAVISRNAAGVYSITQTPLDLTLYAKTSDVLKKANLQVGKNLFDWQDPDILLNSHFGTGGTTIYSTANMVISGYIPVIPGQNLICNKASGGFADNYYNASKVYLSSTTNTGGLTTVPAGAAYIRKVFGLSAGGSVLPGTVTIQQIQIELGSTATLYESYVYGVPSNELGRAVLLSDFKIEKYIKDKKLDKVFSKNLFNKVDSTNVTGFFLGVDGTLNANAGYIVSHYIPILPSTLFTISNSGLGGAYCAYYNIDKQFISSFNTASGTTPSNVYYIRISVGVSALSTAQVEFGGVATAYVSYTENKTLDDVKLTIETKVTKIVGKNLFDKISINNIDGFFMGADGSASANAAYFISHYMPVLPSTSYISSNFGIGGAKCCIYDANKVFVSSFGTDGITTPVNGYFIRMSGQIANKAIQQIEKGTIVTTYSPYTETAFIEPLTENTPNRLTELILPKKLYFIKNKQNCIYYENVLLQNLNGTGLLFFDKGVNRKKQTVFNFSAAATNQTLNGLVVANFKKTQNKTITYDVIDPIVNNGKTVNALFVGDSFTDIGSYLKEVKALLVAQGVTFNLLGTCGNSTFKAEGLSGGTLANTFLNTSSGVSRIVNVTGVTVMPSTGYPGTSYSDSNGNVWIPRGGKITAGTGKLVVTKFGAVNGDFTTFPSSGVLTKISGVGFEGDATINYSTPTNAYFNPFINPSTGLLDLTNYITYWGFASPTLVVFQFTWNDLGVWATDITISALVANFKAACDHVHTTYPSAKVVLSIEPFGSVNGGLDWHGKKYSVLRFTELMLIQFEDDIAYNTWVKVAPSYAFVDLVNGYGAVENAPVVICDRLPYINRNIRRRWCTSCYRYVTNCRLYCPYCKCYNIKIKSPSR